MGGVNLHGRDRASTEVMLDEVEKAGVCDVNFDKRCKRILQQD